MSAPHRIAIGLRNILMIQRATAATLSLLLICGGIGPENAAAFPPTASPARPSISPPIIQHIGWDCDLRRCRLRRNQNVVRIIGWPSAREFLSQVTPYLNCCNLSSVPHYGYSYGPELYLP